MRQVREILGLTFEGGLPSPEVARRVGTGSTSVRMMLQRFADRTYTIITSQLPVASWHHAIGDATYADAIPDRLVHNVHRVEIDGDSMRRAKPTLQA